MVKKSALNKKLRKKYQNTRNALKKAKKGKKGKRCHVSGLTFVQQPFQTKGSAKHSIN